MTATRATPDPTTQPDYQRPEVAAAAPDLQLCRDFHEGPRAVFRRAATYLPKFDGEGPDDFRQRSESAPPFDGFGKTVSTAVGLMFTSEPTIQADGDALRIANPDTTAESDWQDIDRQGTHGAVFAKQRGEDAVLDGFSLILVDFPQVEALLGGQQPSLADERALRLRPYWVGYTRSQLVSWRVGAVPGLPTPVLRQAVLREDAEVDVGAFGVGTAERYRALRLEPGDFDDNGVRGQPRASFTVYEKEDEAAVRAGADPFRVVDAGEWRDANGQPLRAIPLAVCYAGRTTAPFVARPPLVGVAWATLKHWRLETSLAYYETLTACPVPVLEGELAADPNEPTKPAVFKIGPKWLIHLAAGGSFHWEELEGKALDQLRESLRDKRRDVAFLGLSFLGSETRQAETATAKQLDATAEHATLATAAQGIEDGLNAALGFHAAYYGLDAQQAPTVALNREFQAITLDAPMVTALGGLIDRGALTVDTLLALLKRGRVLPQGHDTEAEAIELASAQIAREDREAARLEAEAEARAADDMDPEMRRAA